MDNLDTEAKIRLAERLGKLEGLLVGLQSSINNQSQQFTQFIVRVETLEQRQRELERNVATGGELRALAEKVDSLMASDARQQGRMAVGQFAVPVVAQWAAVVVAMLALVGVSITRQPAPQERQPAPIAPSHPRP